jgi:asparagine synthase (glutamine-hydrolysing)
MAETLRHRGPDSQGSYQDVAAGCGFRRLSIIDLATGEQPIFNEDKSLVLVCNGEIFNYKALRAELISKGHVFQTHVDVEVLVHLYEEYGPKMMGQLNGQFAFAILDRNRQELFLARDHVGIAPLYYAQTESSFVFASEIKAILKYPEIRRKVNLTGLDQIFTFPGLVSPQTMFEGIHRVRPGHYLIVNKQGVKEFEYWDLDYPRIDDHTNGISESTHIDELTERFTRSVQYRLQADVPVGFYLSGGLDSSLTAAFINRLEPRSSRHAFAVTFADQRADEGKYQKMMAERVNCELHSARFDWSRTADMMRDMIYHAECPVKETYNTCSMALSRAAHENKIKVILTGEGADELFAGYVGYRFDQARAEGLRKIQPSVETLLEERMRKELWGDANVFYEHDYYAHREERKALYSHELRDRFAEFDSLSQPLVRKDRIQGRHRVHQRSYLDFKLRMSDHLLMDHGDSMALANSVEARYPFLDIDFIEYTKRIPPQLKLNGYKEKYILRRMGEDLLPPAITKREKFGWYAPGSPEMLQQGAEWICDLLSTDVIRRQGYFDPEMIEGLRKRYSEPGFKLNQPFEPDWLIVVATFGLFKEVFEMPDLA